MATVRQLVQGYGPNFPGVKKLLSTKPTRDKLSRLEGATPFEGRYHDSVSFLSEITSQRAVGLIRFKVLKGKYIALSDALTPYKGKYKNRKVVHSLSDDDKQKIWALATDPADVLRAETIERFTEHDTAAAGDYLKILIGTKLPHLEPMIEGIAFADTSEDTMSLVFGLIANKLVFGHFMIDFIGLLNLFLDHAAQVEKDGPLVMPGLTHEQAAEPTTWGKRVTTNVHAIARQIQRMRNRRGFIPFSGKWNGAIGNSTTHLAAYPDLNWSFRRRYVEEELGLTYDTMTFQASTYAIEAGHFSDIAIMLEHLLKILRDFKSLCSCPGQQFIKRKVPGTKGSSIMPNKTNLWNTEGAIVMLEELIVMLLFLSRTLISYPHEGNMGRSYLFRCLGRYFQPGFTAFQRIATEIIGDMATKGCIPNSVNITAILHTYPGIAGSAIQTVLKREGIEGDAYRQIEKISINPDGSYANQQQFVEGLEKVIRENNLSKDVAAELRHLANPRNNYGEADSLASAEMKRLKRSFGKYLGELERYRKPLL